ncbi:MAG: Hpt domain-containing protein [Marinoscillum sp.]
MKDQVEEVITIKRKFLHEKCQVVVFNAQGIITESCDTLFTLPVGTSINDFKQLDQLIDSYEPNSSVLKGDLIIEIQDLVDNHKYLKITQLSKTPKNLKALESRLDVLNMWLASDISKHQENLDSPAFKLLQTYLYGLTNGQCANDHVPFKLEHITDAIYIYFGDLLTSRHITLQYHASFSSKFLIGNRRALLNDLIEMLRSTINQTECQSYYLQFDFEPQKSTLKVNMSAEGGMNQPKISNWITTDNGVVYNAPCEIVGHEAVASGKLQLTAAEFPYLYNISGGDSALVKDILGTILNQVTEDLGLLKTAAKNKQWNDLERLTHKLKPNFTSIERDDLADLLQQMEEYAIKRKDSLFDERILAFLPAAIKSVDKLKDYQL